MTETGELKAGIRMSWLYIGRLHETTTAEKLKDYVQNKGINGDIECEELNIRGRLKAFKIGIPYESLEDINKAEAWPTGVLVKKYLFRSERSKHLNSKINKIQKDWKIRKGPYQPSKRQAQILNYYYGT